MIKTILLCNGCKSNLEKDNFYSWENIGKYCLRKKVNVSFVENQSVKNV